MSLRKQVYRENKGFQTGMKKISSRSVSGHGNEQIFLDLKLNHNHPRALSINTLVLYYACELPTHRRKLKFLP